METVICERVMKLIKIMLLFGLPLGLAFFSTKNSAIEMITEICINPRYYPKHYCTVPRWIKKCFKVKQRTVPRFICFKFYISVFYAIMGPIEIIVALILYVQDQLEIIYILYGLTWCILLIERIHFIIMSLIYKYHTKEKKKHE